MGKGSSEYHPEYRAVIVADFESSVGTVGTGFWRAPEILLALRNLVWKQTFTQQTDVYSYAMTCYEVITGCEPFEGRSLNDYDVVLRGERPTLPDDTNSILVDLVRKCWHEDPLQTPSFHAVLQTLHDLLSFVVAKMMAREFIDEFTSPKEEEVLFEWAIPKSDWITPTEDFVIRFLRERPHWRGKLEYEMWSPESYWTELTKESSYDKEDRRGQSNLEVYERRKELSEWNSFLSNLERNREKLRSWYGSLYPSKYEGYEDFVIGKKIGRGGEADVFESWVRESISGRDFEYAVKVFKDGYPLHSLLQIKNPGIPRYVASQNGWGICWTLGVILPENRVALVSNRHWGDLRKFIDQKVLRNIKVNPFSFQSLLWFMFRIAMGMRKLHRLGILHRDLKSTNIILGVTGKQHEFSTIVRECNCVYISDFGS